MLQQIHGQFLLSNKPMQLLPERIGEQPRIKSTASASMATRPCFLRTLSMSDSLIDRALLRSSESERRSAVA